MKKFVVAFFAAMLLVIPIETNAKAINRYEKMERQCKQSYPIACIRYAIFVKHLSGWKADWMFRVPSCESGYNPYAYFGHPNNQTPNNIIFSYDISAGLYEFKPSTWARTPYGRHWIWSAKWQSQAAAFMVRQGQAGQWSCT